MIPASETRQNLLREAGKLLAEHGYQGTSLSMVSARLGLTKQALLHHFKSKPLLYGAVLAELSEELLNVLFAAMDQGETPEHQLEVFFSALAALGQENPDRLRLLMRALTEADATEAARSNGGEGRSLQDVLEPLVALIQATETWEGSGAGTALGIASQLLGATCLFPAAATILTAGFGTEVVDQAEQERCDLLRKLVHQVLTGTAPQELGASPAG